MMLRCSGCWTKVRPSERVSAARSARETCECCTASRPLGAFIEVTSPTQRRHGRCGAASSSAPGSPMQRLRRPDCERPSSWRAAWSATSCSSDGHWHWERLSSVRHAAARLMGADVGAAAVAVAVAASAASTASAGASALVTAVDPFWPTPPTDPAGGKTRGEEARMQSAIAAAGSSDVTAA